MTPILDIGIRPDFVVSLDPHDIIYETFGKYKQLYLLLIPVIHNQWVVIPK